jgi:hypothetical protein
VLAEVDHAFELGGFDEGGAEGEACAQGFAEGLEAGGFVDGGRDDREVEAITRADVAVHHGAAMKGHADLDRIVAAQSELLVETRQSRKRLFGGGKRSPARAASIGIEREDREQRVADEFEHFAALVGDRAGKCVEVAVEDFNHAGG